MARRERRSGNSKKGGGCSCLQDARAALNLHRVAVDNHLWTRRPRVGRPVSRCSLSPSCKSHLNHGCPWPGLKRSLAPPVDGQRDGQLGEAVRL